MQITNTPIRLVTLAFFLYLLIAACRPQVNTLSKSTQTETSKTTVLTTAKALQGLENQWVVSPDEARSLIRQGATVLDARGMLHFGRIKGAVPTSWKDFSESEPAARGNLLTDNAELSRRLQAHRISTERPVVVFGNPPRGWGEEGRIVWMLRSLGHTQAVMVDGGFQALKGANLPSLATSIEQGIESGDRFNIHRNSQWSIDKETLRSQIGSDNLIVIDTREPREFSGRTPYGEQRGGHITNAVPLYFKDLLTSDGKLLPTPAILDQLRALNITPDRQIVVYCTGGIRSGWLVAVLTGLGFQAQNYAGSMWEWSAAPASKYPLEAP